MGNWVVAIFQCHKLFDHDRLAVALYFTEIHRISPPPVKFQWCNIWHPLRMDANNLKIVSRISISVPMACRNSWPKTLPLLEQSYTLASSTPKSASCNARSTTASSSCNTNLTGFLAVSNINKFIHNQCIKIKLHKCIKLRTKTSATMISVILDSDEKTTPCSTHRLSVRSALFPTRTIMTSAPRSVLTSSIQWVVCWNELRSTTQQP